MALTTQQQASRLFKKLMGVAETLISFQYFSEDKLGKPSILPSQIWTDADLIPNTASITPNVVDYQDKLLLTHITGTGGLSYYNVLLKDAIPFNHGDGTSYNYTLYRNDGITIIPFGVGDWMVDCDAGVLTFYDTGQTSVSAGSPPKISFYRYIGNKGLPGSNGGEILTGSTSFNTSLVTLDTYTGSTYNSAIYHYTVYSGTTNLRAGTITIVNNTTTSQMNETSTPDIGSTTNVSFTSDVVDGNVRLRVVASSGNWVCDWIKIRK